MSAQLIGRLVWFGQKTYEDFHPHQPNLTDPGDNQPLAAHIAHVNKDGTVNLLVIDATGSKTVGRQNVKLVSPQDDAEVLEGLDMWACWPMQAPEDPAPNEGRPAIGGDTSQPGPNGEGDPNTKTD